ncbi:hypothetical protein D3C73_1019410 [compost metagenome]
MPQITAGRLAKLIRGLGEVKQVILDLKRHAQRFPERIEEIRDLGWTFGGQRADPEAGSHQHCGFVKGFLQILLKRQIIVEGMLHLLVFTKAQLGGSYG